MRLCYECPQPEHIARNCPARRARTTDEAVQGAFVVNRALRNKSKEAYIELEIERQHCVCLLDTKSDVTLFPEPMVKGYQLRESDIELLAANGTRIPVIGTVTVRAKLGGRTITMYGLVSEHIQEVILGLDWLESQGANWNFCEGKLTIGQETHVLLSATRGVFCRRLVAQESVIIPARSEMDVPTMVIYDTLSTAKFDPCNGEWMSEAGELGKGLTLIPHRTKDVPLRVMNIMDTEVRLCKGTAMAEL